MAVPFLFPAIALALIAVMIQVLIWEIGKIIGYYWGTTDTGLTNGPVVEAGHTFMSDNISDCVASIKGSTTTSQDEKKNLIADCYKNNLTNWLNNYQKRIFPDANHTPLENGATSIDACGATYDASAKTPADFEVFDICTKTASDKALTDDASNTLEVYKPDAPATKKEVPVSGIGTTVILIGVGLLAAYLLTRSPTRKAVSSGARKARSAVSGGLYRISRSS